MTQVKKQVSVRAGLKQVTEYTGYKFYRVEDKEGHFLFGFHVQSEETADVYFSGPKVIFNKKNDMIVVRVK